MNKKTVAITAEQYREIIQAHVVDTEPLYLIFEAVNLSGCLKMSLPKVIH